MPLATLFCVVAVGACQIEDHPTESYCDPRKEFDFSQLGQVSGTWTSTDGEKKLIFDSRGRPRYQLDSNAYRDNLSTDELDEIVAGRGASFGCKRDAKPLVVGQ